VALGVSAEVLAWVYTTLAAYTRKHGLNQSEAEHIIDYLVSAHAPRRLRRMSYPQAALAAAAWSAAQQRKGACLEDSPEDITTIHDFGDGTRIVKLMTPAAYKREGFLMSHCVGSYSPTTSTIYSYRDAENLPHVTFEVRTEGRAIQQVKGKGNGPIHPRYIHPVLAFLQTLGFKVRPSEMRNLGYLHITAAARAVLDQFMDVQGRIPQYTTLYGELYLPM